MSELRLLDKTFSPYLNADEIALRVKHLAEDLERDYASRKVLFVSVLNGAFMFTSDLMKALDLSLEISFIKVSSYEGMASTGRVKEIIGLKEDFEFRGNKDKWIQVLVMNFKVAFGDHFSPTWLNQYFVDDNDKEVYVIEVSPNIEPIFLDEDFYSNNLH